MGCRPCCEPFRIVTRNWRSAAVWFWPPCCTDPKPRHCTKDTPRNWKNSTNTGFGPARESVGKSELQTLRSRRQLLQEALKHCAEESPALGWSCHPYGSSSSLKNWPCTENGARGRGTRADLESATTTTWRTISGGLTSSRKNMRTQHRKDQDGELWPGRQLPASRTTECSAFRQHVTALSNGCFYHHHHHGLQVLWSTQPQRSSPMKSAVSRHHCQRWTTEMCWCVFYVETKVVELHQWSCILSWDLPAMQLIRKSNQWLPPTASSKLTEFYRQDSWPESQISH